MPHASQSAAAVVLATRPLGEADLLVVLLTPHAGKVRCAARNARRSKRRFPSGLPGGSLGNATISSGRGSLLRLEAFSPIRDMSSLGRDLGKFAYVAYLCEVTDALVTEPEADPRRFAALSEAIGTVLDGSTQPSVLRRFELRLLDTLGLLPALDECCVCGEPVAIDGAHAAGGPAAAFSLERGGVLCPTHAGTFGRVPEAASIPAGSLRCAKALLDDADPSAAAEALEAAPVEVRRGLRDLTSAVIRGQLRRPLRSLDFFGRLDPRVSASGD